MTDPPSSADQTRRWTTRWIDRTGGVPTRTNRVINGLLEWADKTGVEAITRSNITDAVHELTPIDTDDTASEYVKRCVREGPFSASGTPGLWNIEWEQARDARQSHPTPEADRGTRSDQHQDGP